MRWLESAQFHQSPEVREMIEMLKLHVEVIDVLQQREHREEQSGHRCRAGAVPEQQPQRTRNRYDAENQEQVLVRAAICSTVRIGVE